MHVQLAIDWKVANRLLKKVKEVDHKKEAADGACWEWQGARKPGGYGNFYHKGKIKTAHSVSYSLFIGGIPEKHVVMHICDNPPCINPVHLLCGTVQDNTTDREIKGRGSAKRRGEGNGRAVLSVAEVGEIRRLVSKGMLQKDAAAMFGISPSQVSRIIRGKQW